MHHKDMAVRSTGDGDTRPPLVRHHDVTPEPDGDRDPARTSAMGHTMPGPPGRAVRVAIHAPDDLTRTGLADYLQDDQRLSHAAAPHESDVVVVAANAASPNLLDLLRRLDGKSLRRDSQQGQEQAGCTTDNRVGGRFVLVTGGGPWRLDITAAIGLGLRAVLWRDTLTRPDFTRTVTTVAHGGGSFPPSLQGALLAQVQRMQQEILAPRGLTASGITTREVDVLRLVAEGLELSDVASRLNYSERTVKHVLYSMMKRLQLRNRAHAVSFAVRAGLI